MIATHRKCFPVTLDQTHTGVGYLLRIESASQNPALGRLCG
ncbi:Uncharacterised protein [Vibrio cholerae]|nr:Uncharacterised protein [Vibrio cholerae]